MDSTNKRVFQVRTIVYYETDFKNGVIKQVQIGLAAFLLGAAGAGASIFARVALARVAVGRAVCTSCTSGRTFIRTTGTAAPVFALGTETGVAVSGTLLAPATSSDTGLIGTALARATPFAFGTVAGVAVSGTVSTSFASSDTGLIGTAGTGAPILASGTEAGNTVCRTVLTTYATGHTGLIGTARTIATSR